ncbi:TetR/AcrR family transcriptional regulator [Moritella yayanosii]|uniref:Transcriptional regulator, TetR family n=1 Tax=Moritella yayanosii TaxID=69539 RepID=A0A330LS54_9GAMM|nr:TetR/AcrR family transcriptional regulator [Moritella yayanosii]SQD79489.1 Transcriptional regulator, TetR family [Moritella yayanosii]
MTKSKRTLILDAALALFTINGFHGTTTAAIAREAKVATGTLFHHFVTKEVLIEALYLEVKKEFAQALLQKNDPDSVFPLTDIWVNGVTWLVCQPQKMAFILLCSHSLYFDKKIQLAIWQEVLGFFTQLLNTGIKNGTIKDLPIQYLLTTCESILLSTASYVYALPATDQKVAINSSISVIVDAISVPGADIHLLSR